jgi:hypothetical protein
VRERESHVRNGLRHLGAADELVGSLGELERTGPAGVELDQGEPAERRRAQSRVSDLLGQVDRRKRVLLRSVESLPEADVQAEPLVDRRPQRGRRAGLQQRLLQQRHSVRHVPRLGEEHERLGPRGPGRGPLGKLGREHPPTLDLARSKVRTRRRGGTAIEVGAVLARCQPDRVLASSPAAIGAPWSAAASAASSRAAASSASGPSVESAR